MFCVILQAQMGVPLSAYLLVLACVEYGPKICQIPECIFRNFSPWIAQELPKVGFGVLCDIEPYILCPDLDISYPILSPTKF